MFVNARQISNAHCQIVGYGHTALADSPKFSLVTQEEFINDDLSNSGRTDLFGHATPWLQSEIETKVQKWVEQTSIISRPFFAGSTAELGAIAAKKCLEHAKVRPDEIDAIIGDTNTGPGYPSLADHIKEAIGGSSTTLCQDVCEACTVGSTAIFTGWNMIRSGACQNVLVVCSERATTLAPYDTWYSSNLFGDGAFAFLLQAAEQESFIFFDLNSWPYDNNLELIMKTEVGFTQNGPQVHKFVNRVVVPSLIEAVQQTKIDPGQIDHLIPHQPSGKTIALLEKTVRKQWPEFNGAIHDHVSTTGNLSGASTGLLISQGIHGGAITKGQIVVVSTFGAGLSAGHYGFVA